jgi:hypothetical protein
MNLETFLSLTDPTGPRIVNPLLHFRRAGRPLHGTVATGGSGVGARRLLSGS